MKTYRIKTNKNKEGVMKAVLKAINFANERHAGQVRRVSQEPYITHPMTVMILLVSYKPKSKNLKALIQACILHDVIEDTETTFEELVELFGMLVASLVKELTSDEDEIDKIGKNEHLKNKLRGMSSYALTIKLVDRLANLQDSPKESYKRDTYELIMYLKKVRKLSKTQKKIVADILKEVSE